MARGRSLWFTRLRTTRLNLFALGTVSIEVKALAQGLNKHLIVATNQGTGVSPAVTLSFTGQLVDQTAVGLPVLNPL